MRWNQDIALVIVGSALLCSSCSSVEVKEKGQVGGCVTGSGPLPECETTFCAPTLQNVVVNDRDGGARLASMLRGVAPSGPYLGASYAAPDALLYLSFATKDGHPNAFQYFWMEVYFSPDMDGGPGARIYNQTPAYWGAEPWERLEMAGGRLTGTFKYDAERAHQRKYSRSPSCASGDIGGQCYCEYKPLLIPVVVDVDVTVPQ